MASITIGIITLLLHHHVQKKAQGEIDLTIGRERLPDLSDRGQLPYITAICREVMRWKVITPLAITHASNEDDVYEGYFIPKGKLQSI